MKAFYDSYDPACWLPTSAKEVAARGWDGLDVILFTGDAYVDHPSFGAAVIGRVLEAGGLRVAVVPQPNWQDDLRDFRKLGTPNLFFAVTAGNMDSMVNHYTANKRRRSDDAYTPGGEAGKRPDYALTVYCRILKKLFPEVPVIIGGIEASLRRVTHYDYWQDTLKPSILTDTGATLLFYGMSEKSLIEFVRLVKKGANPAKLTTIPQTAFLTTQKQAYHTQEKWESLTLHSHEECVADKKKYAANFRHLEQESNKAVAAKIIQSVGNMRVVVNPPWPPLSEKETDSFYDYPFTRLPHPRYKNKKIIPAYEMIRHSINIHRGCFGGCAFCTISAHQGKFVVSRSPSSIMKELEKVVCMPDFKGYITDLGGPSANMYGMKGVNQDVCEKCKKPSCVFPSVCKNLNTDHSALLNLYRAVRGHSGIRKATIGSGVRYDIVLNRTGDGAIDKNNDAYLRELITHHVAGRLKVAPEHTSDKVLLLMRKPSFSLFRKLNEIFRSVNRSERLDQQLIPYFISSHPGCTKEDMAQLASITRKLDFRLEQVQDFTPTPMTLATVMYYSGYDPFTMEKVFTARTQKEKLEQKQYFFRHK